MRKSLVVGNWKMNGSTESAAVLVQSIMDAFKSSEGAGLVVCPPALYLVDVANRLKGSGIKWGAQNLCQEPVSGAYTGEVSANMLNDICCDYVIVGHSERRAIYLETDELVAEKLVAAAAAGLTPILCVGETLEERDAQQTEAVIARQLDAVINKEGGVDALNRAVIAYEPVWAIGTGKTATPQQAQDIHQFIRNKLATVSAELAEKTQILYGGSVNAGNAETLFAMTDIDGGLIGGASLKAQDFITIYNAAA